MQTPRRRPDLAKWLLLIPLGLVMCLLLLEAALQLAAWGLFITRGPESSVPARGDRIRVLCLGDSNTYGLYVEPDASYPAQLETLWVERGGSPELEVLNLGYPGMNSSQIVRDVPDLLERLAPHLVILMVGVNDYWTLPVSEEAGDTGTVLGTLRHSRLYRLYRLLGSRFERDPRPIPSEGEQRLRVEGLELDVAWTPNTEVDPKQVVSTLQRNLRRGIEIARSRGTAIALMSYPSRDSFYSSTNHVLRWASQQARVPLVDLARLFEPRCPELECPELLHSDGHPNAAGYRLIAEALVEVLRESKAALGLSPSGP
jgi:lysophospholipase L1-like esterase